MLKTVGAKTELKPKVLERHEQFYEIVGDLLEMDFVKKLDEYQQHCGTSRLQHSINVSYYSFCMAKAFRLDEQSAARSGLLHDLYFIDWRNSDMSGWKHVVTHPKTALENAEQITEINAVEKDAIVKHMWPITLMPPRYAVSYVVAAADRISTVGEVFGNIFKRIKRN